MTTIWNKDGIKIDQDETAVGSPRFTFVFDRHEAKGEIVLIADNYGIDVSCPALAGSDYDGYMGFIDLFYGSPAGKDTLDPTPIVQYIINSPAQTEDPLGVARYYKERTTVDFEHGVEVLGIDGVYKKDVYGYPD